MSRMAKTEGRRPRRKFTAEFKAGAVRLVLDEGRSAVALARELDLTESTLSEWVARTLEGGTSVELTYSVGGYYPGGLASMAGPVDGVLAAQLSRLQSYVETGKPGAK